VRGSGAWNSRLRQSTTPGTIDKWAQRFSLADYLQFLRVIPLLYFAAWAANPRYDPFMPIEALHTLEEVAPRFVWAAVPIAIALTHAVSTATRVTKLRYVALTMSLTWWIFLTLVVALGGDLWRLTGGFCLANATQAAFMYIVITQAIERDGGCGA
jgi:hypothetical protein